AGAAKSARERATERMVSAVVARGPRSRRGLDGVRVGARRSLFGLWTGFMKLPPVRGHAGSRSVHEAPPGAKRESARTTRIHLSGSRALPDLIVLVPRLSPSLLPFQGHGACRHPAAARHHGRATARAAASETRPS